MATDPVAELKTRARLRLNAARSDEERGAPRLRDCLHEVARAVGFQHWEHARRVLGGQAQWGEDMGRFWYAPRCIVHLNTWIADRDQALAARERTSGFLLPYRRQFVLVEEGFVRELGLDPADPAWEAARRDLVGAYGSPAWKVLARQRLAAPAGSFERVGRAGPRVS